jgi:hypothetical protein
MVKGRKQGEKQKEYKGGQGGNRTYTRRRRDPKQE